MGTRGRVGMLTTSVDFDDEGGQDIAIIKFMTYVQEWTKPLMDLEQMGI